MRIPYLLHFGASLAVLTFPALACQSYNPAQIADAVRNSSEAGQALKDSACTWGGAAKTESGGNTCAPTRTISVSYNSAWKI